MPDDASNRRAEQILADINLGDWSILVDDVADDLEPIYASGLSEGLRLMDMSVSVDQVNERAVAWARQSAASMVTLIEDNTRERLRATVATGLEGGWSAARLAEEIAKSPAFDDDRAMMIARTEIVGANNQGNMAGYREASAQGVHVQKEWLTAGDDLVSEECQENEDDGPIDLDDTFTSGDDAPPLHPNCRCAVVPYLPDDEDEGDEG